MPVHIVTDSNCDLPAELVTRFNIRVVPSVLNIEGRSYLDGVELSRVEFYRRLPQLKPLPTTASPSAGDFEAAYRACGDGPIVAIHLASKLSALFNAARLGAEALGGRVTVVDSEQVSMGMGWQVLAAAETAGAGGLVAEVLEAVRSIQRRVRLFAVLDTVEYLRRGGRASAFAALLGDVLQIKPLLEVKQGDVIPLARMRTRQKARESLAERVEALGPLERLAVMHVECADGAQAMLERLAPRAAQPPVTGIVTAVIGTHVGPGTVGVAVVAA